jgi:hypothetical protein
MKRALSAADSGTDDGVIDPGVATIGVIEVAGCATVGGGGSSTHFPVS